MFLKFFGSDTAPIRPRYGFSENSTAKGLHFFHRKYKELNGAICGEEFWIELSSDMFCFGELDVMEKWLCVKINSAKKTF